MVPSSDGVLRESRWKPSARERVNEWFVYVGSQDIQRDRGSLGNDGTTLVAWGETGWKGEPWTTLHRHHGVGQ